MQHNGNRFVPVYLIMWNCDILYILYRHICHFANFLSYNYEQEHRNIRTHSIWSSIEINLVTIRARKCWCDMRAGVKLYIYIYIYIYIYLCILRCSMVIAVLYNTCNFIHHRHGRFSRISALHYLGKSLVSNLFMIKQQVKVRLISSELIYSSCLGSNLSLGKWINASCACVGLQLRCNSRTYVITHHNAHR